MVTPPIGPPTTFERCTGAMKTKNWVCDISLMQDGSGQKLVDYVFVKKSCDGSRAILGPREQDPIFNQIVDWNEFYQYGL